MNMFGGMRVISDPNMVKNEWVVEKRSWGERLFSWPWRPWRKTAWVCHVVPRTDAIILGDKIAMHPTMVEKLKKEVPPASSHPFPHPPKHTYL